METEIHAGESGIPPTFIMGGSNEHDNLSPRNKYGDWSMRKVKAQMISQSSSKCTILEPHPGTLATNEMDYNDDTC